MFEDNQSCIAWAEGAVGWSEMAKHIDLWQHYVHQAVESKTLDLVPILSKDNLADMMTKPLPKPRIQELLSVIFGDMSAV